MDGRIAHDAVVRAAAAGLELRLHEGDDARRRARGVDATGGRTRREGDEGHVDRRRGRRARRASRRVSVAGVRPLHRHDPRVAPERLGQLAATDVERVDAGRAALQQDVGEAAGGGADVEADEAGRVDPEGVQRGGQLVAAPGDVRLGASDRDRGVRGRRGRRPCGPARAASPSPTRTWPAITSACARVRDLDEAALDEELVEADPCRAGRALVRVTRLSCHSPLHRGLTGATRVRRSAPPSPTAAAAPGEAWRVASVSRTWSAIPGASSRMQRAAGRPPSRGRRTGRPGSR